MIDGKLQFSHVAGVVRQGKETYLAKWTDRRTLPGDTSTLYDMISPNPDRISPEVNPGWTVIDSNNHYVKKINLLNFDGSSTLKEQMLREIEACETLTKNPHLNLADYYGCQVSQNRVIGLCFQHYQSTLLETVNPDKLNKFAFIASERPLVHQISPENLHGLREGIEHLHSLNLVHNDITPSNIMLDHAGNLILIDFDSCRLVGESLVTTKAKRTLEWYDSNVQYSDTKNDHDAFDEIVTWLFGSSADEFLFK